MADDLKRWLAGCLLLWTALGTSAAARAEAAEPAEIVVTASIPALRVAPERSLDGADVEAYGLGTIAEVIAEVTAEEGETPQEPAFLVNGKRVQGLGHVADLPAEAIARIDILPAGSGVTVGATPRQKVYAIQLRKALDLTTLRAGARWPTAGGWNSRRADASHTRIRAERRITLAARLRDDALLLESERGVIQPAGALPGAGRYRSLSPASDRADLSLSAADQLATWLAGSINSRLSLVHNQARLGPFVTAGLAQAPLDQRARTLFANSELTLNAQLGRWQIALFGNHAYQSGRNQTDRQLAGLPGPLTATTRSTSKRMSVSVSAIGPLIELPAGPLTVNLGAGAARDSIRGNRQFQGASIRNATTLDTTTLSFAVDVPITSAAAGAPAPIGDLTLSGEFSRQHASDFGSFDSYSLSLLWRPFAWLNLSTSISRSDSAPPPASLDEPRVETPGYRYFDPLRGETVDVIRITGGTPGLRRQSDETRRISANVRPFRSLGLRLNSEYFETRNQDFVSELPLPSRSILQAFPDRFVRDGSGRLIQVDARPVSFARRAERQLRTGFILNLPLGTARRGRAGLADDDDEAPDARARRSPPALRPRLQISASHSWLFQSRLVIRAGQRAIDLLSREAIGFGGLGQPRHRLDASLGYAERGLGVRASVQSRGASLIEASGSTANTLRFAPFTSFSLRAWAQGERLAPRSHWLKGTRLSLSLFNLGNARERVVDRFGVTPLSYQPAYRDPIGRSFEIELRKKF
jgi:hypothetical protein